MKSFFKVLLIMFITITLPLCLLLHRIDSFILQPDSLLHTLNDVNLYSELPESVVQSYLTPDLLSEMQINIISLERAHSLVLSMFTPEWLERNLTYNIQQIYSLRNFGIRIQDIYPAISLVEPKRNFIEEMNVILDESKKEIGGLPDCTEEQQKQLEEKGQEQSIQIEEILAFGCWPVSVPRDQLFMVSESIPFDPALIVSSIPDQIYLLHFLSTSNNSVTNDLSKYERPLNESEINSLTELSDQLLTFQSILNKIHLAIPAALALLFIALTAIIALSLPNISSAMRWAGAALLFASLPNIAIASILHFVIPVQLHAKIDELETTNIINNLLKQLIDAYSNNFNQFFVVIILILIIVAIVSIVSSFFISKISKKNGPSSSSRSI